MGARPLPFTPPAPQAARPGYTPPNYLQSTLLRRAMYAAGARPVGTGSPYDPTAPENPGGAILSGEPPVASDFKGRLLAGLGDLAAEPQDYEWHGQAPNGPASFLSAALGAYGTVRAGQQNRAAAQYGLERQSLQDQIQASLVASQIERNQDTGMREAATAAGVQAKTAQNASDAKLYRGMFPDLQGLSDTEAVAQGRQRQLAKFNSSLPSRTPAPQMTPEQAHGNDVTGALGTAEGQILTDPTTGPSVTTNPQALHDYVAKKYPHLDDGTVWRVTAQAIAEHKKANPFAGIIGGQPPPTTGPQNTPETEP